jgi:N-acyl-D-amino-acid deacylase
MGTGLRLHVFRVQALLFFRCGAEAMVMMKNRALLTLVLLLAPIMPPGIHGRAALVATAPAQLTLPCTGSYDLVIRNGMVVTGDESATIITDVAVVGERIACVGRVTEPGAAETIDATGLCVVPGFVDVHSHADGDIIDHPLAANLLAQGITTVVGGNCGGHFYPMAELLSTVARLLPGVNFASLAGHNTIRRRVMGYQESPAGSQLEEMKALVEQEMKSGAIGLSTGLAYRPGNLSRTDEVIALAEVAARSGGIYATHTRDEGSGVRNSILEAIRIAETHGMRLQISHIKLITEDTWGRLWLIRQPIEAAIERGVRVTTDQHPYTATSTSLLSLIPTWAWGAGFDAFLSFIARPDQHAMLVRYYASFFPFAFDRFMVATCPSKQETEGLTLRAILDARRQAATAENGAELIIELQATGWAQGVFFVIQEDDVDALVTLPYNMIASDSSSVTPEDGGLPHPRNFGTFPRALQRFVVERRVLTLEDAVRKMTSLPARTFGLAGRGTLQIGAFADLVVLDLGSIRDNATYVDPYRAPTGIRAVVVNGYVALRDGALTGARAGQVLYGPGRKPTNRRR